MSHFDLYRYCFKYYIRIYGNWKVARLQRCEMRLFDLFSNAVHHLALGYIPPHFGMFRRALRESSINFIFIPSSKKSGFCKGFQALLSGQF